MHGGHFHVADARRFDPTGTGDIRSRFRAEIARRWQQMRRLTLQAITETDVLGIGQLSVHSIQRSTDPVREFQSWLDTALKRVVVGADGDWVRHYLDEAAARARTRAMQLVPPSLQGQAENVHGVVASTAAVELQGIAEAVSQRAVRVISQGLLTKARPRQIALAVSNVLSTVGGTRSKAMVEQAVNSAFNNATLDTFKTMGLTKVGTISERIPAGSKIVRRTGDAADPPGINLLASIFRAEGKLSRLGTVEVLTAGDDDVCQICEDISDDGPYPIDEARGLIPAHPNCRCAFVPFFDKRFAAREKS